MDINAFSGVKVFSATMAPDRDRLGDRVCQWLSENPGLHIVDKVVLQSSDQAFHCLSITLFFSGSTDHRVGRFELKKTFKAKSTTRGRL